MIRDLIPVVLLATLAASGQQSSISRDRGNGGSDAPIEYSASQVEPLKAAVRIAAANKIPMGIVLGVHPYLCSPLEDFAIRAPNAIDAIREIVRRSGYQVTVENNTILLMAPDPTPHQMDLLRFRFEKFSAANSTIDDAGALLAGYIMSVAEGANGFITNTLSNGNASSFNINLTQATTKQIANHIVSLDGKGLWILYPVLEMLPGAKREVPVRVYSYSEDDVALSNLTCNKGAIPQNQK